MQAVAAGAEITEEETPAATQVVNGPRHKFTGGMINMSSTELDRLLRAVGFGCVACGKMDGREFGLCKNAKDITVRFPVLQISQAQLLLRRVQEYVAGTRTVFPTISCAVDAPKQSGCARPACTLSDETTGSMCAANRKRHLSMGDHPAEPVLGADLTPRRPSNRIGAEGRVNMASDIVEARKRDWLDLLLQHAVAEADARSCIRDVADDMQLIGKIKELLPPSEATERLMHILSFPMEYKRPWLNVLLRHGLSAEQAKTFVSGIHGGIPELEHKLRDLPIPRDRVLAQVCARVWLFHCVHWCMCISVCVVFGCFVHSNFSAMIGRSTS